MIINKYNNGGGSSSSTTYAESAETALQSYKSELLEGQAAFPENPNDGDVVAIKVVAPTRGRKGTRSASIETGVYQYSSSAETWNKLGEGEIPSFLKAQLVEPEGVELGDVYAIVDNSYSFEQTGEFVNNNHYNVTWDSNQPQAILTATQSFVADDTRMTIYLNKNGAEWKNFTATYTSGGIETDVDFIVPNSDGELIVYDGETPVAVLTLTEGGSIFVAFIVDSDYSFYRASNDSFFNIFSSEYAFTANTQTHVYQVVGEGEVVELSKGGGSIDSGAVQTQIDRSISGLTENLESGDLMVGMAAQLYSPDGVTSEDWYAYRTTAGDEDVNTGDAELRKIEGNATYPEPTYTDNGALTRGGEPIEGFEANFYWGDSIEWTSVTGTQAYSYNSKIGRVLVNGTTHYVMRFRRENDWYEPEIYVNSNDDLTPVGTGFTEVVGGREYLYKDRVDIKYDGSYIIAEWVYTVGVERYFNSVLIGGYTTSCEVGVGATIPNDIPIGESTYTYSTADTAWTPSLPQAVSSMTLNSETYVPQDGDEITITRTISSTGSAVYMKPTSFVSLGLNSFDYTAEGVLTSVVAEGNKYMYDSTDPDDNYAIYADADYTTYAIYAVTGLTNGYVIHLDGGSFSAKTAGVADSNDAFEIDNADFDTTIENGNLIVYPSTAMPYIILSVPTADADKICVHPRWSGKMDNGFEEYHESTIDISNLVDDCPLLSIGEVRNTIDLQNKKFIERISMDAFSVEAVLALIDGGKVYGTDFYIDEDYIYVLNSTPQEDDIDIDAAYKDNDFSVEYFLDENGIIPQAIFAENYYITNLVDKLRRMRTDFIHLDDPNTAGEVGKVYEYQGRLMKWVEGSGYTAEWLKMIDATENDEGTGLIYSIIPDGTKLFEFKYNYGGTWRNVVYSGNTLYLTETAGTVVCAVTVGNTFQFNSNANASYNIKGVFNNGYIGFIKSNWLTFQNIWSGNAVGGHYELIDHYNHPYLGNASYKDTGIVRFNGLGQVIKKVYSVYEKAIKYNTTGTGVYFITTTNTNPPSSLFAPTAGGNQGQTLVSAGANAAPVWETRIKVVKITSADYEALVQAGTTDPNTLYAIDDE